MSIYITQSALGLISLALFRNNYMRYLTVITVVYLFVLTAVGTLDVSMSIYFVLIMLPLVPSLRFSPKSLPIYLYFLLYLFYGLIFQDKTATIVTLLCKYFQFIIFFIVYDSKKQEDSNSYLHIIYLMLLAECILGVYLLFVGDSVDANSGLVRLVSNHQPITGNLCIIALPLILIEYYRNQRGVQTRLIAISFVFLVWVILSGTRGYMLLWCCSMLPVLSDFVGLRRVYGRWKISREAVLLTLGIMFLGICLLAIPTIWDKILSTLRLSSSTGIRGQENAASIYFWLNSTPPVALLGIGLGGMAGSYASFLTAASRYSIWYTKYLSNKGALFHNLYANVLTTLGVVGIAVISLISLRIINIVRQNLSDRPQLRLALVLYVLGFLLMNYYRWSGTCGIAEMIVLALVVRGRVLPLHPPRNND